MAFSFKMPQKDTTLVLILLILFILTRLPALSYLPFVQDEAIYAMVVEEQRDHPTLVPTFMGEPVSWKPPLFYWTYAIVPQLPIQLEARYRFPSFLFGLGSIIPLYFFLRNMNISKNHAFFSLLIVISSFLAIYSQNALLADSLLFFLICSALFVYSEEKIGERRFALAAILSFAAFFVKFVVAAMIPLLALSYFYTNKKEVLRKLPFLLSLLAIPLAFICHLLLLQSAGIFNELYSDEMSAHFAESSMEEQITQSVVTLLKGDGIWAILTIFGLLKYWKENKTMTVWLMLIIFPLLSGGFKQWHFLPIMPALAYFAAGIPLKWEGKEKVDGPVVLFISIAVILSLFIAFSIYQGYSFAYAPQKEAGLLVSGQENVLVIGTYAPGVVAYKILTEREMSGSNLDFGWILIPWTFSDEQVSELINNYNSDRYTEVKTSFSSMFTQTGVFRKDTNITDFDYVVLIGNYSLDTTQYELLYDSSKMYTAPVDTKVYRVLGN